MIQLMRNKMENKMNFLIFLSILTCTYGLQLPFMNLNFALPGIPSFPKMSIPAFNNPLFQQEDEYPTDNNLFGQLEEVPEMRGMENNQDVKTHKETKTKDGFEITTVNKTGPGFFEFMSEVHSKGNNTNGTKMDFSSAMMNSGNLLGGLLGGGPGGLLSGGIGGMLGGGPMLKRKCKKKCPLTEFCDPFYGKCRKRLSEGNTCMMINQCKKDLQCVWGRCQKASKGDPGTFCKSKDQCSNGESCIKEENAFHAMCVPALDEGAICGTKLSDLTMNALSPERNRQDKQNTPCKSDLKCGNVGHPHYKRCVKKSYIEESEESKKAIEKIQENEKSEDEGKPGDESSDDDNDNNGSGDDNNEDDKILEDDDNAIPIKTEPKKSKKKNPNGAKTSGKFAKRKHF